MENTILTFYHPNLLITPLPVKDSIFLKTFAACYKLGLSNQQNERPNHRP